MGKSRTSALMNGIFIGLGAGFLLAAWIIHEMTNKIEELESWWLEVNVPGGENIVLVAAVGGVIFLAMGIGIEAYQRAGTKEKE